MAPVRFCSALPGSLPVGGTAYVSTEALKNNYLAIMSEIKRHSPSCESICVVKADAYGHTTEICAPVLARAGCKRFAVANIAEAYALHKTLTDASFSDFSVLILGRTDPAYANIITQYGFIQCVYSEEYARELSAAADGEILVHIKADTGMNRLGFCVKNEDTVESAADSIFEASRTSWGYEAFNLGRKKMARLNVRGKTLVMYLALDPSEYVGSKYHIRDMSEKTKYASIPVMVRIKSPRGEKFALELIEQLMEKQNVVLNPKYTEQSFELETRDNDALVEEGLIKIVPVSKGFKFPNAEKTEELQESNANQ